MSDQIMKLRIESGHPMMNNVEAVSGNLVRFVTDDGRTMFEVSSGEDSRSIEVRAVDTTNIGGKFYTAALELLPQTSNSIVVRTKLYGS